MYTNFVSCWLIYSGSFVVCRCSRWIATFGSPGTIAGSASLLRSTTALCFLVHMYLKRCGHLTRIYLMDVDRIYTRSVYQICTSGQIQMVKSPGVKGMLAMVIGSRKTSCIPITPNRNYYIWVDLSSCGVCVLCYCRTLYDRGLLYSACMLYGCGAW